MTEVTEKLCWSSNPMIKAVGSHFKLLSLENGNDTSTLTQILFL